MYQEWLVREVWQGPWTLLIRRRRPTSQLRPHVNKRILFRHTVERPFYLLPTLRQIPWQPTQTRSRRGFYRGILQLMRGWQGRDGAATRPKDGQGCHNLSRR